MSENQTLVQADGHGEVQEVFLVDTLEDAGLEGGLQLDKHVTLDHVESVEDVLVIEGDLHAWAVYLGADDLGCSTDICGVGGDGDVLTLGRELEPDGGVGLREDCDTLDGGDERL